MRTVVRACVLLVLLALAPACTASDDGRPQIVVTTNILGDLTRAVVGDTAAVTVLMPPNADPHQFAISAQTAARIERADLLVHNGLGLEEGVRRHIGSAEQAGVPAVAVGELVDPIRYRNADANGPDPHFWTDPRRVRRAVEILGERVAGIDGVDAAAVRANTSRYLAEVDRLDAWMGERFATIPPERRKLVTNHHVFGYLAARFGFEVIGAVIPGGTTLASPSASDLAGLADTIRAVGVPAVFADSSQPDRLARVLAEQAGLHVRVIALYSESLTEPGGGAPTYPDMMRANTEAIVGGLTAP
ncbi:zinc/manganese transport system substrate-binding protein [Nocardia transvalensis]|uniref:Zinc/manganese transport system substrate-binding protein n=1 Tax=Nocardia transvalensis TaxID=37333 RepID=A0A7W9PKW2_9NOCA|nr:zinc ABC transporter substrate-binding protein AztC [Nocardia transvalensis]MBB5917378.1 zinc/manganese transport system substrate-binding protein [Nocardia transvalensis]